MRTFVFFLIGVFLGVAIEYNVAFRDNNIVSVKSDTVEVVRDTTIIDTVIKHEPKVVFRCVKDTLFIPPSSEGTALLVESKEYRDSDYAAWVSGVQPQLDSIHVYHRTTERLVMKEIRTTEYLADKSACCFAGVGIKRFSNVYMPTLNFNVAKSSFLIGAEVGFYDNTPTYGININYKIK